MFSMLVYFSVLITFATCMGICFYIRKASLKSLPHRLLLWTQICYALWALLILLCYATPDFEQKIFLSKARQLFLPALMPTWVLLVVRIYFRGFWEKHRLKLLGIYIIPALAIVANLFSTLGFPFAAQWTFYDFTVSPLFPALLRYQSGWVISSLFLFLYVCGALVYGIYIYFLIAGRDIRRQYALWMFASALPHVLFEVYGRRILHSPEMMQLSIAAVWPMAWVLYYIVSRLDFMDLHSLAQQQVFENLPSPVIVVTTDNTLWEANTAARKILNLNNLDLGCDAHKLTQMGDILSGRRDLVVQERHYQIHRHGIYMASGDEGASVYILSDITEVMSLNQELSENNELLQNLNARILAATQLNRKIQTVLSHDMSGSLWGVNLLLHNVRDQVQTLGHHEISTSLNQAADASAASLSLLRDVLAWSKHETDGSSVCLKSSTEKVLSHLAPQILEKSIRVNLPLSYDDIQIHGSSRMVESVLRNILSNAIRYSHSGGNIEMRARRKEAFAEVTVTDQGVGMDESQIAAILNRQVDTVGLDFTMEFITHLGGRLDITSTPGAGSTFTVLFPFASGT